MVTDFLRRECGKLNFQIDKLIETRHEGACLTDITRLLERKIALLEKIAVLEAMSNGN